MLHTFRERAFKYRAIGEHLFAQAMFLIIFPLAFIDVGGTISVLVDTATIHFVVLPASIVLVSILEDELGLAVLDSAFASYLRTFLRHWGILRIGVI